MLLDMGLVGKAKDIQTPVYCVKDGFTMKLPNLIAIKNPERNIIFYKRIYSCGIPNKSITEKIFYPLPGYPQNNGCFSVIKMSQF